MLRKSVKRYLLLMVAIFIGSFFVFQDDFKAQNLRKGTAALSRSPMWDGIIAKGTNNRGIRLQIDGNVIQTGVADVYMNDDMVLMLCADKLTDYFSCASNFYDSKLLVIEKYNSRTRLEPDRDFMETDGEDISLSSPAVMKDGRVFVPSDVIEKGLNYGYSWDAINNMAVFTTKQIGDKIFPYRYDYRDSGRLFEIKNQSSLGTCWAFAALTALETSLAPEHAVDFSEDHMSINNNFSMSQNDGGEYAMAIAYLASWTGPVLEKDDPYGDGFSPEGLASVVHVQEAQILESKNYDSIKKAVFLYGGVQSSLYMENVNSKGESIYYNGENSAYCYIGPNKPNHDIVIIGWDDTYPASNFNFEPDGDGAFICANSWGSDFGDGGVYYVSYFDSNIGVHNMVYTGIEGVDNYDRIYQSDLCGWVGQIGYDRDYAYFANVYEAVEDESLEAVSFYALAPDTRYEVYFVDDFKNESSFSAKKMVASGVFSNAGYYTVPVEADIELTAGKEYAIVVYIQSPNTIRPVAVEFKGNSFTDSVIIDDGKSYISAHGDVWSRLETTKECNVCLKMFTNILE